MTFTTPTRTAILVCSFAWVGWALLGVAPVSARTPLPFFQNVDRFAVFCGAPTDAALRQRICETARDSLSKFVKQAQLVKQAKLKDQPVTLGPERFNDAKAITALVNGYLLQVAGHQLLTVTLRLRRHGMTDGRLYGPPPIVQDWSNDANDWRTLEGQLAQRLNQLVVAPWRRANPTLANPALANPTLQVERK